MKHTKTLYEPSFEHDNCGIGAIVSIDGSPTHQIVTDALKIVEHLEHRAGKDAEGKTGDGVGILTQIPHTFFKKAAAEEGTSKEAANEKAAAKGASKEATSEEAAAKGTSR